MAMSHRPIVLAPSRLAGNLMVAWVMVILMLGWTLPTPAHAGWELWYGSSDRCFPTAKDACDIYKQTAVAAGWCGPDGFDYGDALVETIPQPTSGFPPPLSLRCVLTWRRTSGCGVVTSTTDTDGNPLVQYECGANVIDRYHRKPRDCRSPSYGNPIHPLDAAKILTEPVLGRAIGSEKLEITYDSSRKTPVLPGSTQFQVSPAASFGELWSSNLHKVLKFQTQSTGTLRGVQAFRGNGLWISFSLVGTTWTADGDINDVLQQVGSNWRYVDHTRLVEETYNSDGKIVSSHSARGGTLTYTYSDETTPAAVAPAEGLLISIADQAGRSIQFKYEQPSGAAIRIYQVVDAGGRIVQFHYDTAENLNEIVWPDTKIRRFVYERTDFPWAITGIVDENNSRATTYGYDSEGRATETQRAGGIDHYTVSYTNPPAWESFESNSDDGTIRWRDHYLRAGSGTVVTRPDGTTNDLLVVDIEGAPRLVSQTQPAGSGCAASTRWITYQAKGNIYNETDFNGHATCYAYDTARNLETVRQEGLTRTPDGVYCNVGGTGPLEEGTRKITTAWHPDWRLPVRRVEPGKLTTWVYHGQADPFNGGTLANCAPAGAVLPSGKPIVVLCKQVEQATSDANGRYGFTATVQSGIPARTRTWTYDANGQTLTAGDPLGRTVTYTYYTTATIDHAVGDPQSVVNAAAQTTTFTKYAQNGLLLQSTDANGVLTVNTYDARDRLLTTSLGGQAVSNEYDGIGQLKKVTQADGSWIAHEYDAAHRRTATVDSQSNRIDYTLDAQGNVTAQSIKDPGGTLRRALSQVIDALGRVQQTTGGV